jgi:hypothetical protein
MAERGRLLNLRMTWCDGVAGAERRARLRVPQHPSEAPERSVLRILAWGLFGPGEGVFHGDSICRPELPDLEIQDAQTGGPALAVLCGRVCAERIARIARRYPRCPVGVLLEGGQTTRVLRRALAARRLGARLGVWGYELTAGAPGWAVDALRTRDWQVDRDPVGLRLTVRDHAWRIPLAPFP